MNETLTFADFQDTGNAQAHLVLLAVARCADWETGECWPGVKTIAKMAKCSERTARSYLAKLRDDGFIETESRKRDDGSTSTDLIRLVGYAEWIAASRAGRKGPKPKAVGKYVDIPPADIAGGSEGLPPPPASMLAAPPCKQVAGANEPSLEHKSNSSARTREADDLVLKGSGKSCVRRHRKRSAVVSLASLLAGARSGLCRRCCGRRCDPCGRRALAWADSRLFDQEISREANRPFTQPCQGGSDDRHPLLRKADRSA